MLLLNTVICFGQQHQEEMFDIKKIIVTMFALALFIGAKAFGQEWEYTVEFESSDSGWPDFFDAKPMKNGNNAVPYIYSFAGSSMESYHPGMVVLSQDGIEQARNDFYKPSFWGLAPFAFSDDEGSTYILAAYNPDHDSTSANYFMNFDNPPDHSILGLYKIDEQLTIMESHEIEIPIDTLNSPTPSIEGELFNSLCGNIYLFSAIEDEGTIVGGYTKKPTFDIFNSRGNDSIFFFRMGFDGTLINRKGYEIDMLHEAGGACLWEVVLRRNVIAKRDNGFAFYYPEQYPIQYGGKSGERNRGVPGTAYYLDEDLNIVAEKNFHYTSDRTDYFADLSVVRSDHNTVYASSAFLKPDGYGKTGCCLYEYDESFDECPDDLPILQKIERTSTDADWDYAARLKGVALAKDQTLFYAYSLEGSRMMIEHLDLNFDTITTLYYEIGGYNNQNRLIGIEATEDGGLLIVSSTINLSTAHGWLRVTKFPAEAFVGIEEAHDCGLKVAIAYPNPGKDVLNIRTGLKDAWVEVYDMNGILIHSQALTENVMRIDATDWAEGVYVWKVIVNGVEVESGKWIKE